MRQEVAGWAAVAEDPASWRRRVRWLDRRLEAAYRSPRHGNLDDPTDEVFYILLSKKTPPERYLAVFRALCDRWRPWDRLLQAEVAELETLFQPLGISRLRAEQVQAIARKLHADFGSVSLEPLRSWPLERARDYLISLSGVGEKSARCVLMYSLGKDISPMDTHATRVLRRFGLLPPAVTDTLAHRTLDERLPAGMAYRLHVNLVAHGRAVCQAKKPACEKCRLLRRCAREGLPRDGEEH